MGGTQGFGGGVGLGLEVAALSVLLGGGGAAEEEGGPAEAAGADIFFGQFGVKEVAGIVV